MKIFDARTTAFNIHNARMDACMTMQNVADACGISVAAVAKWESGRATPTIANMVTICDIFHCDIGSIISTTG